MVHDTQFINGSYPGWSILTIVAQGRFGQLALSVRLNAGLGKSNPFWYQEGNFLFRQAFAMSINRAQGQALAKFGISRPWLCCSHRQLHAAFLKLYDINSAKNLHGAG